MLRITVEGGRDTLRLALEGTEAITDTMNDLGAEDAEALGAAPRTPRVRKVQRADAPEGSQVSKKARGPKKPRTGKSGGSEEAAPAGEHPVTERAANDAKIIQLDQFRKK